jgi:hypothetical protein
MVFLPDSTPNDQTTISKYQQEAKTPLARAVAMSVNTPAEFTYAASLKVECRTMRQRIVGWFHGTKDNPGPTALAYASWKKLTAEESKAIQVIAQAEAIIENKLLAFRAAEARRQAAEQLLAEAEAKRRAEDERLDTASVLAAEAALAGDASLMAAAEEMLDFPVEVAPVYVASAVPKVVGVSFPKRLHVEVTDLRALVLAVAAREMIDMLPVAHPGTELLKEVLEAFKPPRRSAMGALTSVLSWLKTEAKQQGTAFALPGVLAEERDDVK